MTPDLSPNAALLLDMDGTLLDIAPTPDAVVVPPWLAASLGALRTHLNGALAIVTGRPVEQVDALLPGAPYAVAGEHGGAIRHSPEGALERPAILPPPASWLAAAEAEEAANRGVLLERKARGFVLHFRLAPTLGPMLRSAIDAMFAREPDAAGRFVVMAAHMAWEVKSNITDKGRAVESLMARAPFAGREPTYIGDDVTDEDGMAAARRLGGRGLRVAEAFGDPAGVREWLADMAARLDALQRP